MSFDAKSIFPITYSKTIELRTTLPVEECKIRLTANTIRDYGLFSGFDYHEFRAEVNGNSFWLRKNWGSNSWRVIFTGDLAPQIEGTRIAGQFTILPFVEPF